MLPRQMRRALVPPQQTGRMSYLLFSGGLESGERRNGVVGMVLPRKRALASEIGQPVSDVL